MGLIADHPVSILIDEGSTHNFLHHCVVLTLGFSPTETVPLRVTVGNDDELHCHQLCVAVTVHIQNHSFTVDFHILPLCGADVVLGVQWLKTLGPVLMDYASFTMKFITGGLLVELQGDGERDTNLISPSQLRRLPHTNSASTLFHIRLDQSTTTNLPVPHSLPAITNLTTKYSSLFQPLTTLPPSRPTDHKITLKPNSSPVNVRPYRYRYSQKQEIEEQVASMLASDLIRPSSSPFSSPVLLIKKKDDSWHFCIDYRALNAITVRDRFPIPTVDELLDELRGDRWFSKLDLMQGYHQILMNEADISKTAFRTHPSHYEFRVMPFGICNAPSSFQATMNQLFIKGYASLAAPLTKLLCHDQFQWSSEATKAFQALKDAITNSPILALPDFCVPFVVETMLPALGWWQF
ncbi:uncharacterized protein [Glycine max]|uniref:uncharacterized protein n=1 Tax=Glycine max TaxID=3847 RepID=UPI0003DE84D0|nr:uncharacterized protein LOC102666491 [Glycine max]|eukprot:XP_006579161.1 uncharacterized protein LOC102666491 [Glycine max]